MNRGVIIGILLTTILVIAAAFFFWQKPAAQDFSKAECADQPNAAACLRQEQQLDDLLRQCAGAPDERACMEERLGQPLEEPEVKITVS
jgi:hypothetical protein